MSTYQPLGRSSPSLQPSLSHEDIDDTEQLNLGEYGRRYEPYRAASNSQPPSPPSFKTTYDSHPYGGPSNDIESAGLIKEEFPKQYRVYKRRWFGLIHLTLLVFAIGWGNAAPGTVAYAAIKWYGISYETLNYLSIVSMLVFLAPAPFVIWIFSKWGPKWGILIACVLTVLGNWVIYAGAAAKNFEVNMAGTVIGSLAMPFAQSVSTQYAQVWFSDKQRTTAVAISSLAYVLGAGFGAMVGPSMVKPIGTLNYGQQALIIAIVFTAVSLPAPFLPNKPPTPPSEVAASVLRSNLNVWQSLKSLCTNPAFWLQFFAFSVFAGTIDTATAVTNQALAPYGFAPQDAGYSVAALIFAGIGAAAIVAPILDKTGKHILVMKIFAVIIAIVYTVLPFVPESRSPALLFVIFAAIGIFSISLEPAILEYQATSTHPVSPEFSATFCWCGVRIIASIFTYVVGDALPLKAPAEGQPRGSLFNGLIFIAAMGWVASACLLLTEVGIFKAKRKLPGTK